MWALVEIRADLAEGPRPTHVPTTIPGSGLSAVSNRMATEHTAPTPEASASVSGQAGWVDSGSAWWKGPGDSKRQSPPSPQPGTGTHGHVDRELSASPRKKTDRDTEQPEGPPPLVAVTGQGLPGRECRPRTRQAFSRASPTAPPASEDLGSK